MVARFRINVIDFRIPYKDNNFRINTDESVNLVITGNIYYVTLLCGIPMKSGQVDLATHLFQLIDIKP